MSNNAHELSNRLLNALDNNYNVVDMHTVNEIISILEKFNITKELLETTRLGKHVNELRRKTTDPSLARRAKVLVKRWRDLVIPSVASPGHPGSNRSSAERTVRRLGGTPLTSPALQRQGLSPAVPSPRPPSRPAWGGYESDSQDVILVDDDPPPPAPLRAPAPVPSSSHSLVNNHAHKPLTPPVKRPPSIEPLSDERKAKRDKKPKKRRGHGRAGSGTESPGGITIPAPAPAPAAAPRPAAPAPAPPAPWRDRNGTAERRRNGCRKDPMDPYTALVNRMPKVGDKKVKTTQELLEQIQSRGARAPSPASPASPASPHSPDVMLIEPDVALVKVESPLRNGAASPAGPTSAAPAAPAPLPPLEDAREYAECTCGELPDAACPGARRGAVRPLHVRALHHALLPGVNGTRAPPLHNRFAVRHALDATEPNLFAAVVPLYNYSDYADDYCAKNMSKVPLCTHLPWTEFAPEPPELPPPREPPPLRPYPEDEPADDDELRPKDEPTDEADEAERPEPSERLATPPLKEEAPQEPSEPLTAPQVAAAVAPDHRHHRTVERTKEAPDGLALFNLVRAAADDIPYDYGQMFAAPVVTLPEDEGEAAETLEEALAQAEAGTERDALGRPSRPETFAEWYESARLGDLVALPYVVID